jgi:DNA-directed RNA polymerase subunit RPC12/RpoP
MKRKRFMCSECEAGFNVLGSTKKQPVQFCPFCSSAIDDYYIDDEPPIAHDFDEMDDFESKYYEEDEE